jgi:hypothetical protein
MSSGLELIPLGIMLIGALSKSIRDRAREAEEEGLTSLMTRMVDPVILKEALESENLNFEGTDNALVIGMGDRTIRLVRSEGFNYGVVMNQIDIGASIDLLERIEERYCSIFQQHVASQMEVRASSLGYPVQRVETGDETIRLRITVS